MCKSNNIYYHSFRSFSGKLQFTKIKFHRTTPGVFESEVPLPKTFPDNIKIDDVCTTIVSKSDKLNAKKLNPKKHTSLIN